MIYTAYQAKYIAHELTQRHATDNAEKLAGALFDAALAGIGPALLPDWLVDAAVDDGQLVDLFPHLQATATTFDTAAWLVYPSRAYLPGKVRVMIDFLKEQV